ncbi:GntR family transcriptional regulator [Nesterenkonia ebinurensis]|uniref:GntR family transcriptional regulator n=1 Tax=Nesterenkonia ebinurensis TaxID=2608252 RepID=UPI00168A6ADB|nr:GntR family transcriptional regulator [Nesterenkonia ebinurensis]
MAGAAYQLSPASLQDALFESLRSRIINGEISPGEKVTESRVAQEYEVARPTAKSCLDRLTSLGLLRRSAHKPAVVPVLTEAEIEDLFFSRATFESAAAAALAQHRRVPEEVSAAQDNITQAAATGDFRALVKADIAFHWGLINGLNSPRLARMYQMITGEIHLTIGQYRAHRRTSIPTVAAEHQAVIDAILTGDSQQAASTLRDHINLAKARILAQRREDQPASTDR